MREGRRFTVTDLGRVRLVGTDLSRIRLVLMGIEGLI